jgi:hypothetical protein
MGKEEEDFGKDDRESSLYDDDGAAVKKQSRARGIWNKHKAIISTLGECIRNRQRRFDLISRRFPGAVLAVVLALGLGLYFGLKLTKAKGEDTTAKNVISNTGEGVASALDRMGSNETETASSTSLQSYVTGSVASALSSKVESVTKAAVSSAASSLTAESTPGETSTVA